MRALTIYVPDNVAEVASVDVAVHFNSDLRSVEAFAKLVDELTSQEAELDVRLTYGQNQVLAELPVAADLSRPGSEVTYYGPHLSDEPGEPQHKPMDLLHARAQQLRSREADKRIGGSDDS